jgi:hypothetical protein
VSPARLTGLIKEQTSLADLQDLLQHNSSIVNDIHINAALQWLVAHAQEQPQSPEQLAAVVQEWMGQVAVDQLTARLCANLAYYCSKLGYVEDLGLYRGLLQRFMVVKGDAEPQGVSNLLYALGSQEQLRCLLDHDVLVELLQRLKEVARTAKPQDLSNALWAAAKTEPGDSPQLKVAVAQLLSCFASKADAATPQQLSNVLYALALLPRAWAMDSALQLVERLLEVLPQADSQNVANVLWALGRYAEHGWFVRLSQQWMNAATQLLFALPVPGQLVKGRPGPNRSVGICPQELANGCMGMAKLIRAWNAPPGQLQPWQEAFSTAVRAFVPLLPKTIPLDVANMMWACAEVRHYPQQLLQNQLFAAGQLPGLHQAGAQSVANIAWALAVLAPDLPPAALMASLLQRVLDLLAQQPQPSDLTPQHLANTAWAVAGLDQQQLARQLEPLAAAAFSQQQWGSSQEEALSQWHQVHLWLTDTQVLGPAGLGAVPGVTQQQLAQCRAAWEEVLTRDAKASEVQKEVAKVSTQLSGLLFVLAIPHCCFGWQRCS